MSKGITVFNSINLVFLAKFNIYLFDKQNVNEDYYFEQPKFDSRITNVGEKVIINICLQNILIIQLYFAVISKERN